MGLSWNRQPQPKPRPGNCTAELRDILAAIGAQDATLAAITGQQKAQSVTLNALGGMFATLGRKLDTIMTEDAAVAAAAADLTTDAATLTTAVTALQGLVTSLTADVASNPDAVSQATQAALAAAQAAVDTVTGTAAADVTTDTPPTSN